MEKLTAAAEEEKAGGRLEEEEKKKLYVFVSHCYGEPYVHSFYEVPIPNPSDLPLPAAAAGTPKVEEERSKLLPILSFTLEEHGREMCCVHLNSKVYFIGGHDDPLYHQHVYILDTSSSAGMPQPSCSNPYENMKKFLKLAPSMNAPKVQPIAFEAQGKIFVLCSNINEPGVYIYPFEMFTPPPPGSNQDGVWEKLAPPPFRNIVLAHVVVNHRILVRCHGPNTVYLYDINSNSWNQIIDPPSSFDFGFGSLVLENKLYNCSYLGRVRWITVDWSVTSKVSWKTLRVANSFLSAFPSAYLAGLGKGKFCYIQLGCSLNPDCTEEDGLNYNRDECLVNLTVFDSSTNKKLGRGAFTLDPFQAPTKVVAAFAVSG